MAIPERALAPGFQGTSYDGRKVDLEGHRGRRNVLLVLLRGLGWPYCRRHLVKLARSYESFVQLDTEVIAVGPDRKPAFEAFFSARRIPFPGVPDPEKAILEAYGQQSSLLRLGRLPAQLIIDKKGVVQFADYGKSMRDITPVDELIQFIAKMEREG